MSEPITHYSASELAGLPGMPGTSYGVQKKADREGWKYQLVDAKGGPGGKRKEYPLTTLPAETRDHLLNALIAALPETVCQLPAERPATAVAVAETTPCRPLATLKKWQTTTMDARCFFMRLIEEAEQRGLGVTQAIRTIVRQATRGELPAEAAAMVPLANKRSGTDTKKRTLSETSLYRWWSAWKKDGKNASALAPKDIEKTEIPAWFPHFLKCYQVPQKISIPHALEDLQAILPAGMKMPSEHQVRRFLAKYSKLDIHKGRMTGKELKSLKGFIRRDTSMYEPLDICLCDGHSFKAKVAHPVHGRPFKPEVCGVIDAVTRVCIGWSAGLAESSQTVADAYRHAITLNENKRYGGIPAILYADKGAGNEAKINADPYIGMYSRLGSTYRTGIPGNSQARGLVERMQASLWIRAAKKLPTYTGHGMDEQVQRKVYLAMEKDVKQALKAGKQGVKSELLISWQEFLQFAASEVEDYNRRPHKSLPRITDSTTGLRRHMCPLEMWSKFLAEGWEPVVPEAAEMESLFRPHVTVTTRRNEVRLFGNIYYAPELTHYNGQPVIVAYDIHDASQVWVKDGDERLICIARFEANKKAFYPVSAVDKAREDRRTRRTKTLERHLDEVQAEANPAIDIAPAIKEIAPEAIETARRVIAHNERKQQYFDNAADIYHDICRRQQTGDASDYEIRWADAAKIFYDTRKKTGLFRDDPLCSGRFPAIGE